MSAWSCNVVESLRFHLRLQCFEHPILPQMTVPKWICYSGRYPPPALVGHSRTRRPDLATGKLLSLVQDTAHGPAVSPCLARHLPGLRSARIPRGPPVQCVLFCFLIVSYFLHLSPVSRFSFPVSPSCLFPVSCNAEWVSACKCKCKRHALGRNL
jgi:hypothetical protein